MKLFAVLITFGESYYVVTIVIITEYNDRMTMPIRGNDDNSFQSGQYLGKRSIFFREIDKFLCKRLREIEREGERSGDENERRTYRSGKEQWRTPSEAGGKERCRGKKMGPVREP